MRGGRLKGILISLEERPLDFQDRPKGEAAILQITPRIEFRAKRSQEMQSCFIIPYGFQCDFSHSVFHIQPRKP